MLSLPVLKIIFDLKLLLLKISYTFPAASGSGLVSSRGGEAGASSAEAVVFDGETFTGGGLIASGEASIGVEVTLGSGGDVLAAGKVVYLVHNLCGRLPA